MTTTEPDPTESGPTESGPTESGAPASAEQVLDRLREPGVSLHLFRGFGPLVIAGVLVVVMMLLAPSVAPERVVERPVDAGAPSGVEADR